MRILLPPSEAKHAGGRNGGVDLVASRLAPHRTRVAAALIELCERDPGAAAQSLALPARSREADLDLNRTVLASPTRPALDRYAGTVYEGLDAATLTAAGRRRAMESVLIFSGLFGVLGADEHIPAYRLPVSAALPSIGALTPFWRAVLAAEMVDRLDDGLIIDLRSSDYSAMWRASGSTRDQVVSVRIVSELPGGRLAVISYPSKYGKGRLARALVASRARITSIAQVAQLWTDAGERDATIRPGGVLELLTAYTAPPAPTAPTVSAGGPPRPRRGR